MLVRAITNNDLDDFVDLAAQSGGGMTTLKADRIKLGQRIEIACASFAEQIAPPERDYVFVMEESISARIIGVCAVKAAVGLDAPFYNYRVGTLVHSSIELNVFSKMETLTLTNDLTGSAELCSLFLHPQYRSGYNGKLLSKSRLMFMAQFPHLFPDKVIAEMRGFQRPDGTSPFWDHLGQHFFKMDFNQADDLSSQGKKSFIAELMPRYPLYVAYLPQAAQDVIGLVHVQTAPARRLLEQEGLHYDSHIDIFDAGPVLQARICTLRAVRESQLLRIDTAGEPRGEPTTLVSSTELGTFRVIVASSDDQDCMRLSIAQQAMLRCSANDQCRVLALNPTGYRHA